LIFNHHAATRGKDIGKFERQVIPKKTFAQFGQTILANSELIPKMQE